ncbi:PREDICTED: putative BTB/POZ domain-containing protein At2g40450 [Camelina sativa]|uniref:BTB/POZ domain-containing protein At2g40450 n=1 Tax=Camelina sativa TaxID=90675 RepID=A0ABM0YTU4_CAMSA|nr:PREDICTED: putative BTB/POZ domain-containing protein At2g40450 [Camelina sativa]
MEKSSNKDGFLGGFRKLLTEQWQSDVQLKAGDSDEAEGATIPAHKLVLAARSEVFKRMLEPDGIKASPKVVETITLPEMKHEEVEALVDFIYSVDSSFSSASLKKHARSLYLAADKYDIPHLRDLCRTELISSLNSSNALSIFELAQIPFDFTLSNFAFNSIQTNLNVIADSDEFKLFVVNHPNLTVAIMKTSLRATTNNRFHCYYCGRAQW